MNGRHIMAFVLSWSRGHRWRSMVREIRFPVFYLYRSGNGGCDMYLVNEVFEGRITFHHAGLSPIEYNEEVSDGPLKQQLKHFYNSLIFQGMKKSKCPDNWMDAFFISDLLKIKTN